MWDIEVKETVWHRLANEIFFRILRGEYTIGKKLPSYIYIAKEAANSHFPRPAGPHFPASQGHIKRSALEIGRARGAPPC